MSWFSQQWDKLSRAFDDDHAEDESSLGIRDIEVIWGRDRLRVSLPPSPTPHTLSTLKSHLSQQTSIPPEHIKLVYHGLVLKDPSATLRSYNVRSGSRIMLIGSVDGVEQVRGDGPGEKRSMYASEEGGGSSSGGARGGGSGVGRSMTKGEMLAEEKRRKEEDRTEAGVQGRIQEVLDKVKIEVEPKLDDFEARIGSAGSAPTGTLPTAATASATTSSSAPQATTTPNPTSTPPQAQSQPQESLEQSHRLLNELLSRSLLSLDAIPIVSETTRAKRKGAVREVQSLIDRLDRGWEGVKEARKGAGE
ncbi:hypothetical protein BCV69DRAFT_283138 [Microstroma glucosiphilum]|uniref:Uncharacterized protein n=1 Tax=Pseudomicrostroma glucosiphilum TaxID=1684307 RepID=A0A316U4U4_9BASI|nr:hypothetical protein BCV69DRAFT_283138 [Pseudomicrostroma glucosiphilum]PWN20262.1 hypothetical protein BCV69DRAFT_283138 [Pseudomicrostroma glucosiphilum]